MNNKIQYQKTFVGNLKIIKQTKKASLFKHNNLYFWYPNKLFFKVNEAKFKFITTDDTILKYKHKLVEYEINAQLFFKTISTK